MPHQCLKCGHLFNEGSTVILRGCPECRGSRFFYTDSPLGADERKRLLQGSEVTLREAIEDLVKKAKEGLVETEEDGWVLAGPAPTEIVADPATVPADLPQQMIPKIGPRVTVIPDEKKVVVKLPVRRKGRRDPVRWEYVAPEPKPSEPSANLVYKAAARAEAEPALPVAPAPPEPASPTATKQTRLDDTVVAAQGEAPASVASAPTPTLPPLATTLPPTTATTAEPDLTGAEAPETIRIQAPGRYEIDVKRLLEDSPVVVQRDGTYLIHLPSLFDASAKPRR